MIPNFCEVAVDQNLNSGRMTEKGKIKDTKKLCEMRV